MIPLHDVIEAWKGEAREAASQVVERPCLCGGRIRTLNNERAIAYAVRVHNDSTRHVDWAVRNGWR